MEFHFIYFWQPRYSLSAFHPRSAYENFKGPRLGVPYTGFPSASREAPERSFLTEVGPRRFFLDNNFLAKRQIYNFSPTSAGFWPSLPLYLTRLTTPQVVKGGKTNRLPVEMGECAWLVPSGQIAGSEGGQRYPPASAGGGPTKRQSTPHCQTEGKGHLGKGTQS